MINLIKNPDFSSKLECWDTNSIFSYEIGEGNCLNVQFEKNPSLSILSQKIILAPGMYFLKAEINTLSRFIIELKEIVNDINIKSVSYNNGCINAAEFQFEIKSESEIRLRFAFTKGDANNKFSINYVCIHCIGDNSSPYLNLPAKSFWSSAVANKNYFDLDDISSHQAILSPNFKYATAGSCFAQHISRHLRGKGATCLDLEMAPVGLSKEEATAFGYNQFSCRYGNIYTTRQLYQLFLESEGRLSHGDDIWCKDGRFYDALRPSVDPVGYARPEYVRAQREIHLQNVSKLWRNFDVFVFTLGLTECWASREFGSVYPTAPGTVAGCFDSNKYELINLGYEQIYGDLDAFWQELKRINPAAKLLLTVSPVPLTATASDNHVLIATTYSKSVLRTVAGEFVKKTPDTYYFPSFEIINSHPSRGMFYNPNLRTVNKAGVDFVMSIFFGDKFVSLASAKPIACDKKTKEPGGNPEFDVFCDDELLDNFNKE